MPLVAFPPFLPPSLSSPAPQLLSALDYFHQVGLNYHTLCSEHVLLWSMEPVSVKLSDSGITHTSAGCEVTPLLLLIHVHVVECSDTVRGEGREILLHCAPVKIVLCCVYVACWHGNSGHMYITVSCCVSVVFLHQCCSECAEEKLTCPQSKTLPTLPSPHLSTSILAPPCTLSPFP